MIFGLPIGVIIPCLLFLIRLLQGLSVSGEAGGASIYLLENSHHQHRYLISSLLFATMLSGIILPSMLVFLLLHCCDNNSFLSWGWRIPFLFSFIITFLGFYLRYHAIETPVFSQLKQQQGKSHHPIQETFSHYWTELFTAVGIVWIGTVVVYLIFIFMPSFANHYLHFTIKHALHNNIIIISTLCFLVIFFGYLSDHWHPIKVMQIGATIFLLTSLPIYYFIIHAPQQLLFYQLLLAIPSAMIISPALFVQALLFPAKIRYSAFAISYNFSVALFGGTAPFITIYIIKRTGLIIFPAIYITLLCPLFLLALHAAKNNQEQQSLRKFQVNQ